jgi:hypothetical protein
VTAAGRFLWPLAGRPSHGRKQHDAPDSAACLVCGEPTGPTATTAKEALGINFDLNQAARRDSTWVCEGCAWALAGRGLRTLRLWTVAAVDTPTAAASHPKADGMPCGPHIQLTNRADMRWVAHLLTSPPPGEWLVTVAVSGQKHVVPYAHTNTGRGAWAARVEGHTVTAHPDEMRALLARVAALRAAGFGPDQIASLNPGTHMSSRDRLDAWRTHADPIHRYRGSPLLALAALMPTKEHLDEYLTAYPV